jgi:hypothetical protein
MGLARRWWFREEGKDFFLKKEAKTFALLGACMVQPPTKVAKVVWFFLSKKNTLESPA